MPVVATAETLLAQAEVELSAAQHRREVARARIAHIINTANSDGRSQLTPDEETDVADARAQRTQARKDIAGIRAKIGHLQDLDAEENDYAARGRESTPTPAASRAGDPGRDSGGQAGGHSTAGAARGYGEHVRVTSEPRTYTAESDPYGRNFLMDVARAHILQDPGANARLSRHMAEERVERTARQQEQMQRAAGDTTTGNWAGLTVPQYLTDMYAPVARALRPFADICNKHPLPGQGMSLDISRITTGTAVGQQVNELDPASAQSADDTLLTIPVLTATGQQKVSRQAIDRGTGIEDVLLQDLFGAYASSLDNQLITTASTGLSAVASATTFGTTTATAPQVYPKVLGAMAGVEAALLNMGYPTHAVMHSRRWYWFAAAQVNTFPFIQTAGMPLNAVGVADPASHYNSGARGRLPIGLEVIVDNNIATNLGAGTNQDEIYVVPDRECHLWEDPNAPVYIRAEQPAAPNLGVLMVVYGYFAFTFSRYVNAMQKVNGAALQTPTF